MRYLAIGVITAINCALLAFFSLLAVGGDGSTGGMKMVLSIGFAWIGLTTWIAVKLAGRGNAAGGVLVSCLALPAAYLVSVIAIFANAGLTRFMPTSSALTAACQSAGAWFYATPTAPVRSIAYDYNYDYPLALDYFVIDPSRSVRTYATVNNPDVPPQLLFTESRLTRHSPRGEPMPPVYVRSMAGKHAPIEAFTADVLVSFLYTNLDTELAKAETQQGLVGYELTITDRRDGSKLALIRYFTELRNRRACGPVENDVLDVMRLIYKASGMTVPTRFTPR
jgi:hypothetical protein